MRNILLITTVFAALIVNGQGYYGFKNSNFETWTNATTPADWTIAGGSMSKITREQSWEAGGGHFAGALKNETGNAGKLTMSFPFTSRVPYLMFDYKFQSGSAGQTDTFEVDVQLTHWVAGAREVIARTIRRGNLTDGTWQTFSYPFAFFNASSPDSCFISISSSVNAGFNTATVLNIDNFRFQAPSGNQVKKIAMNTGIYPNPVKNDAAFTYELKHDSRVQLIISDITGKIVDTYTFNGKAGKNEEHVSFEKFKSGIYFYEIKADDEVKSGKFSVSH
jgi:hypothetical protein